MSTNNGGHPRVALSLMLIAAAAAATTASRRTTLAASRILCSSRAKAVEVYSAKEHRRSKRSHNINAIERSLTTIKYTDANRVNTSATPSSFFLVPYATSLQNNFYTAVRLLRSLSAPRTTLTCGASRGKRET